jgi:hypothetical protein
MLAGGCGCGGGGGGNGGGGGDICHSDTNINIQYIYLCVTGFNFYFLAQSSNRQLKDSLHYFATVLVADQWSFCKLPQDVVAADALSNASNAYATMPFLLPLASFAPRPK